MPTIGKGMMWLCLLANGCALPGIGAAADVVVLPVGTRKIQMTGSDRTADNWNLIKVGSGESLASVAPTDQQDAVVAVLDTGVDAEHPDLKGRVETTIDLIGSDTFTLQNQLYMYRGRDGNGHGTHVASIVLRVAGPSRVRVLPIKIIGHAGTGQDSILTDGIERAIAWRGSRGARVRVINLSVASQAPSERLKRAIDKACKANILVVVAAGNDRGPVDFPASLDTVLTVSATTYRDESAGYSSFGPAIDIAAPGGNGDYPIIAAWPLYLTATDLTDGINQTHTTQALVGTSMAAPHVSAAAAMLWSSAPYLGAWQVRARLLAASEDLGAHGWDSYFGFGRLNVLNSLRAVTHDAH
jgi:subtilisin family serine protease